MVSSSDSPGGASLVNMAERELGAFLSVVSDTYGPEQAEVCAEDWLEALESMDKSVELTPRELRLITITAAARLADHIDCTSTKDCRRKGQAPSPHRWSEWRATSGTDCSGV